MHSNHAEAGIDHPAISIKNLSKSDKNTQALNNLSLNIPFGCFYALLGPNGAGKSSLIRILATLMGSDSGEVWINGIDALKKPREARTQIGYVAQESSLDKILTGYEHLIFTADLHHLPRKIKKERIDEVIEQLNMSEWVYRRTKTYSGGMRRRLELGCALLHKPKIFILDEPSVGLDPESRQLIWEVLKASVENGQTVLLSTHQLQEVEQLADQLAILDHGKLIAAGKPKTLKEKIGGQKLTLRIREFSNQTEAKATSDALIRRADIDNIIINPSQGYSLTLITAKEANSDEIVNEVQKQGFPIFSCARSSISIDDIYLKATGSTIADAELSALGARDLRKERKEAMR